MDLASEFFCTPAEVEQLVENRATPSSWVVVGLTIVLRGDPTFGEAVLGEPRLADAPGEK
jgi:hypothetical protein